LSILCNPKDRGFSEALCAIDRCQIAMVCELAHASDGRLILKCGMAMRMVGMRSWCSGAFCLGGVRSQSGFTR